MQFNDQVDFIRQHLKKNRMRVFMTVLAATMGTAFLIVLASVGFGLHETIRSEVLDNRLVTEIEVYEGDIDEQKMEEWKKSDHVKAVIQRWRLDLPYETQMDGYKGYHNMTVTSFEEEQKAGFALAEGRLPEKQGEVVVGYHFASQLYEESTTEEAEPAPYDGELLGKQFTYFIGNAEGEMLENGIPLTIVGIAKEPTKEWVVDERVFADNSIVPLLYEMYGAEDAEIFYRNTNVYADDLENVKVVSEQLRDEGYSVYSISDELDQLDIFFTALKAGLVFVGTIAILIASIGIFNTMTMAVTERTREIGVMKAIGANPKLIQRLFLMESAWIGLVGTVLAVLISYGVSMIANWVLPIIVASASGEESFEELGVVFSIIPWQLVVIASVISLSVAILSGWRPARKATKIDVIDALRQEL
ncbi:FtsX-like permease family protein [Sporosarcina sp. FSL W7-1349]|uniref:ABC transporter permease n=1 Tax=Sporosarcina sp. FSL W7-1349 TaxID=2921561 RepID=UPI0030FCCEAF